MFVGVIYCKTWYLEDPTLKNVFTKIEDHQDFGFKNAQFFVHLKNKPGMCCWVSYNHSDRYEQSKNHQVRRAKLIVLLILKRA